MACGGMIFIKKNSNFRKKERKGANGGWFNWGGGVGLRQVGEGCWVGSGVGVGALLLPHFKRT